MRIRSVVLISAFCLCFVFANGQEITYGFRAGLSYSKLRGDLEMDASGNIIEDYRFASGFHIGIGVNLAITDLFGFRGELLFTQRGYEHSYEGDSYFFLARATLDERVLFGKRKQDANISMANVEVPLLTYFKVGPFEFLGGFNVSFLMAASGGGGFDFEGISPSGNAVDPFRITLAYNFVKDEAGGRGLATIPVRIDNSTVLTSTVIGAYYDFDEKDGNLFNVIDIGLMGGLSYYLNQGLYLGGRVIYGLIDVDDNQYDISLMNLDADNNYISRSDKNQNLTFQVSIGFLF